jgi:hypothetical protein
VVVVHELFAVEHEQVIHLGPDAIILRDNGTGLERDVGCPARLFYDLHIPVSKVRLVSSDLGYVEAPSGLLYEWHEEIGVVDGPTANVHGGNYLRLHAAYEVTLEPLSGLGVAAVLMVIPPDEAASREPRGVYGKVCLDTFQGQAASRDELFEYRCKGRVRQVAVNRGEMRAAVY